MRVATGCGSKEVYRFPHTTYPYSSCICSFLQQHPYFLVILLNVFRSFVMDNAPYHSRRLEPVPTMSSRKQVMQDWLTSHRICFRECALKRQLYNLIRSSNFKPKYAVDEMARATRHESCAFTTLPL